jgi:hypothetical protein
MDTHSSSDRPRLRAPELIARELGDGTVATVLGSWFKRDAPEALLWRAAELFEGASPAMVMSAARWLGVTDELAANGLSELEIAQVLLSAASGEPRGWVPDPRVLARAVAMTVDVEHAAALGCEAVDGEMPPVMAKALVSICAALLARGGRPIPEAFDERVSFSVPWQMLRDVIEALPPDRRDRVIVRLIGTPINANAARVQLRYVLPILDLTDGPGAHEAVGRLRALLAGHAQWSHLVEAADAGGGPPPPREGPTAESRAAVGYWLEKYEAARRRDTIGDVARRAHARAIRVAAPELASFEQWRAASGERREEIARAVGQAVPGMTFDGFENCGAGPIAGFTCDRLPFRLIPGGVVQRGLSAGEEALVREEAEARKPEGDNWFEQFGYFLDELVHWLRPVQALAIGPLLASATSGHRMAPGAVAEFLESSPFRLPSEAEWEYLARGGIAGELTWRGHVVPGEAWFHEVASGGAETSNRFGRWGFGIDPEICADAWHGSYDGAPADGSPWWGEGDRVARGGAGMLYPWQEVGEWQLLCTAMRGNARYWEYELNVRPVIGIEIGRGTP